MRVIDLFSCLGFHALGFSRAGAFETVAFCEANPWRREQLAREFPGVPIHDDVQTLNGGGYPADVCFGGPPCQGTSRAAAIHGTRDGRSLWSHMLRVGLDAGAEWFVVEQPIGNQEWEEKVAGDLARAGRHVARLEFGGHDVGAPYPRRRVFLISCTSLPRLQVAWAARSSAIERAKRSAMARGDWDAAAVPAFGVDTWRAEHVRDRQEAIEALGDSNPPAMSEVVGHMLWAAR